MKPQIIQKHIIPSILWFVFLFLAARILDQIMHDSGYVWVGRYLGIPGTIFIVLSFIYSLRKKKVFTAGKLKYHLKFHEWMAWIGSLMILVHAGIHLHAFYPWMALASMLIVIISGFVGGYLQKIAQSRLAESRDKLFQAGMDENMIDETLYIDSLATDFMKKWRSVHLTIASFFTSLSLFHIISVAWYMVK
ncbi:MAG: hypothetical protein OEV78_07680 [Spirochaetia bacterium]|nr:hypothetical protein [Spirochaetia bacterium]